MSLPFPNIFSCCYRRAHDLSKWTITSHSRNTQEGRQPSLKQGCCFQLKDIFSSRPFTTFCQQITTTSLFLEFLVPASVVMLIQSRPPPLFLLFRATLVAYGGSQTRGLMGVIATAAATPDLSHVCDPLHSSWWQCQIPPPLFFWFNTWLQWFVFHSVFFLGLGICQDFWWQTTEANSHKVKWNREFAEGMFGDTRADGRTEN